jgi:hypothetical protein
MKNILALLPETDKLKHLAQSLATLEAILCPNEDSRYHRFNNQWSKTEAMASLDNGSGDHVFTLF